MGEYVFEPQNELERLLMLAATDAASRPAFLRAMLTSELLVVKEGPPGETGPKVATEGTSLQIQVIPIEGKPHTPVFSSPLRISEVVKGEVATVAMNGESMLKMLRGSDVILNPGGVYGKVFTAWEIDQLLSGAIFQPQATHTAPAGTKVMLAQPNIYPNHITEPLARLFAEGDAVQSAYLALMALGDASPHFVIGLDVHGDFNKVVEDAGVVVRDTVKEGEIVDFCPIQPGNDPMSTHLRGTKPFYRRKKFLGLF